jgi:hypothetical protein
MYDLAFRIVMITRFIVTAYVSIAAAIKISILLSDTLVVVFEQRTYFILQTETVNILYVF